MVLMIDNYDSFTYNLVQYLGELGAELEVHRSRKIGFDELDQLQPERIVISPGPCTPREAGISNDVIKHFSGKVPILGVCLGHQCVGDVFGGEVVRAERLMHGKTSMIQHNEVELFEGLDNPFEATRYHSLIVKKDTLPDCLEITAWTDQDEIMGIRHKTLPVWGVQFHPESILTTAGKSLLSNFLAL
ncbi:MAG: aminodeoxychorismate/anthranilate synthase component II [Candidatus Poribacteria bacterium]|nr:aminodeoxychorismate/anthranilate synthase component II [Candidatus Poribacteria bacterium]